jgi:hypothetical protein
MTENDCTCINCKQDFKQWKRTTDCQNCEDGSEEVENEFGEGSFYRQCRTCNGTREVDDIEYCFCSEDCIEDLTN